MRAITAHSVIVAQMGKVGSSSLVKALGALNAPVYQVHHVNRGRFLAMQRHFQRLGVDPDHIRDAETVLAKIVDAGLPAQLVSMVRDPIARNVSAFFENKHLSKHAAGGAAALSSVFLRHYPHHLPLEWFDVHIKPTFDLDVFESGFDHEHKYLVAEKGRYRMLVLRAEDSDLEKALGLEKFFGRSAFSTGVRGALRRFFGWPGITLGRQNVGAKKGYSDEYAEFMSRFRCPDELMERMYTSKMAKHFYREEELSRFAARWCGPSSRYSKCTIT